jgi:alpha-amylase
MVSHLNSRRYPRLQYSYSRPGIPIIYYGQEQGYSGGAVPNDREALWTSGYSTTSAGYTFISTLNKVRLSAVSKDAAYVAYQSNPIYSDSHTVAMKKSSVVGVFSNIGSSGSGYSVTLPASTFTAGQALTEVVACKAYTADSGGGLTFTIGQAPSVFYPTASLSGSGVCGTTSTGGESHFSLLSLPIPFSTPAILYIPISTVKETVVNLALL